MTAIRQLNFRQGDLSEYLAHYLIASLGLATPVPRQEDIGIDFHCSLADNEEGNCTAYGYPFLLQTKSTTNPRVRLKMVKTGETWSKHEIEFMFRQELPIIFGVVDKSSVSISLFSCSPIWFLIFENPLCAEFELIPDIISKNGGVGRPEKEASDQAYPSNLSDGYRYLVKLGPPIITLTAEESRQTSILKERKEILRRAIFYDQLNITYSRLKIPHFHWLPEITTNSMPNPAYYYAASKDPDFENVLYSGVAPTIISLALSAEKKHDAKAISELRPIVLKIPQERVPSEVRKELPSFYSA